VSCLEGAASWCLCLAPKEALKEGRCDGSASMGSPRLCSFSPTYVPSPCQAAMQAGRARVDALAPSLARVAAEAEALRRAEQLRRADVAHQREHKMMGQCTPRARRERGD